MRQLPVASDSLRRSSSDTAAPELPRSKITDLFQNLSLVVSQVTVLIGLLVLLGWWLRVDRLTSLVRGWPVMLPNSAFMFVAAGSAAGLLGPVQIPRWRRSLGRVLSVIVIGLATLTLGEYLFGWNLGIDSLLFHDLPASWSPFPGRPSAQTSISFVCTGIALLVLNRTTRQGQRLTEYLCLSSAAIALLALLGYIHDATPFYGMTAILAHTGMAAHTAAALVLLNLAILLCRPQLGGVATLASGELGGFMARRLLVATLGVFLIGTLLGLGQRSGLYGQPIASALLTFVTMAALIAWGLHIAASLNRVSGERRAAHNRETLQRRFLETVIDQMPEGIELSNANGEVELQNRAWRLLAGADGSAAITPELVALDIRQTSGEVMPAERLPLVQALVEGKQRPGQEFLVGLPAGKLVPVLISAAPIERGDGQRLGAVMVVQDISPLKDLERLRKEWSALVAHDLRQPSTTIELCVDLLSRLHAESWSDTERLTLQRIQRANHHLKRMIDDLLDVSRLEADRLPLHCQEVDLVALARVHLDQLTRSELRGRPVRFATHGTLGPVWADGERIDQVLNNLLTNAVKYGDPDTEIAVELRPVEQAIQVSVTNRGRGIEPDDLPRLFQRFSRGSNVPKIGLSGIGLGLYICKGLIEAHGGRIWAHSTPGQQTSFHFTLPRMTA